MKAKGLPYYVTVILCGMMLIQLNCSDSSDSSGDPFEVYQTVDERFLSIAVDSSRGLARDTGSEYLVVFDYNNPRLRRMAQELAPGYLRIGGSDADVALYVLSGDPPADLPEPYNRLLTGELWDTINDFAAAIGFDLMFTLNAGPGPRDGNDQWIPDMARELIEYTVAKGYPVAVWEFGNEINGFTLYHDGWGITAEQYVDDLGTVRGLIDQEDPGALLAGPANFWIPVLGEIFPLYHDIMEGGGHLLDIVTWHYYPQASDRCEVYPRYATPYLLMEPENLDEIVPWADEAEGAAEQYAPDAEIWLGETSNAQCGGQLGISDVFVAGFWWLDQLGLIAKRGQKVTVRQTLAGDVYGLIDPETLEPRPDYWNSLLWNRLMGPRVLNIAPEDEQPYLRTYAHCTAERAPGYTPGSITALAINLDRENPATVAFEGLSGPMEIYRITTNDLFGKEVYLNGVLLQTDESGDPPDILPEEVDQQYITLEPATYAFIVFTNPGTGVCK
ncbi:MAG: hypothetical protein JSU92_09415 [Deltaproteobacteria bacterium]|nr:MAG: hypothetical protein JSU92_09415 [Deltaproteobacteria bacterium]